MQCSSPITLPELQTAHRAETIIRIGKQLRLINQSWFLKGGSSPFCPSILSLAGVDAESKGAAGS